MITDDPNEKPMASNSVNQEEGNRNSNPRVESYRTHTGKTEPVLEESITEENANTDVPAYSINHPDGRETVEKDHMIKYVRLKDDKGSESRLDPIGDTTDESVNVSDDTFGYGRPVHFVKSDSEVCDKRTTDDPVAVITMTTDVSEKNL